MKKNLKIGWMLVREGVISRPQLENILDFQQKYPDRRVGEIATDLFNIPEEKIESVYVNHVLCPLIEQWFYTQLTRKLPDIDIAKIVPEIKVSITDFSRSFTITQHFSQKKCNHHGI